MRVAKEKSRWAAREVLWDEMWTTRYNELLRFIARHGHPHVPKGYRNRKLSNWVKCQRERRRGTPKQRPPKKWQIKMLDRLGFVWDGRELHWLANYQTVCEFKKRHGHCEIKTAVNPRIARWLSIQRQLKIRGQLPPMHKCLLDRIDFVWEGERSQRNRQRVWRRMYLRLKQYLARHGNTHVPRDWPLEPALANWVATQRQNYQERTLSQERIDLLNRIGFTWQLVKRGRWEDHYAEAVAFKAKHGHCRIRGTCRTGCRLERWARRMQCRYNCGLLSSERVAKLDAIGFDWSSNRVFVFRDLWEKRYQELVAYHGKYGHCNVPCEWKHNKPLARWVAKQRASNWHDKLDDKRKGLLNAIGFNWSIRRGPRKSRSRETDAELVAA